MSLLTSTEMDDLPPIKQAEKAIRHILELISTHPEVGWYIGMGTQSFALLTEADATLHGHDISMTRTTFRPVAPKNPYEDQGYGGRSESNPEISLVDMTFVTVMERELSANQRKGDWRAWKPDRMTCVEELNHHLYKLKRAIRYNIPARITEHCADLANIAMKTAERHGERES